MSRGPSHAANVCCLSTESPAWNDARGWRADLEKTCSSNYCCSPFPSYAKPAAQTGIDHPRPIGPFLPGPAEDELTEYYAAALRRVK